MLCWEIASLLYFSVHDQVIPRAKLIKITGLSKNGSTTYVCPLCCIFHVENPCLPQRDNQATQFAALPVFVLIKLSFKKYFFPFLSVQLSVKSGLSDVSCVQVGKRAK